MRWSLILVMPMLWPAVVTGAECAPGTWRQASPLPVSRTEVAAASDGQAIYLAGGLAADAGTDVVTVYRYDPVADGWSGLVKLDKAVHHAGLVVVDGKLYVVGGYEDPGFTPTARVRVIDLATGAMSEGAPMPAPRGALAAVVLDGRIHAVGGTTDKSVGTHEVFDPATNQWSAAAPMQVPRNHLAAAVLDGKIYAFGGRDEATFLLDAAEAYDPASDRWSMIEPLPTGRSGIGAAVSGGRIAVFGGERSGEGATTFTEAEAYDPATGTWSALAPMPTGRHGLGVAAVGDDIFAIAGGPQPALTVSDVNEVLCGGW